MFAVGVLRVRGAQDQDHDCARRRRRRATEAQPDTQGGRPRVLLGWLSICVCGPSQSLCVVRRASFSIDERSPATVTCRRETRRLTTDGYCKLKRCVHWTKSDGPHKARNSRRLQSHQTNGRSRMLLLPARPWTTPTSPTSCSSRSSPSPSSCGGSTWGDGNPKDSCFWTYVRQVCSVTLFDVPFDLR